ncbi:beta-propeller domain-containing protein [Sporosarcina highlanderae]|uniref:Beta-propeller domain-containing protein n=1 Tax=Sporosarcina highlanderae TaxID=3035916 RepID=A0ABT8JLR6_9BACL|nr:beta-propeller domain-containing protein [Sporosarcina highlanderae]MDN4606093.1 beta-propeller domain-containing protein [Sporosarcina highlanderae]
MRKPLVWLGAASIIIVLVISFAFMIKKVTVSAAGTALTDNGWNAYFSEPLVTDSITAGYIYVTDQHGKKVQAEMELSKDGQSVQVNGLQPGKYTLHLDDRAVNSKFFKSLNLDKLEFTVYDSIESISSAKDLKAYFETIRDMQTRTRDGGLRERFALSDSAESAKAEGGAADYSSTNIQVEGVDESDFVKTNGDYIYAISDGTAVEIVDIRDSSKMKLVSTVKMEEYHYASQLFLHGDLLIVLGDKYEPYSEKKVATDMIMPVNGMSTVSIYSVKNPENPELIREIGIEGHLSNARKANNILYLVTTMHPHYWAMDEIEGETLRPVILDSNGEEEKSYLEFEDIAILPGSMEASYTVISAIDLDSAETGMLETKGFLGSSSQMYMTKDSLYLTAMKYEMEKNKGGREMMIWNPGKASTGFFKFNLDGTKVVFYSSAEFKGTILNQFSMDEYNGNFRVVMTEGNMWDDKNPSKNHLFILNDGMQLVGSVEGLAEGERIYSARFMGDKAYMVTFRETDPLFVIDVADPTKPEVLGELKIPGFSNYLHPLDENHLIGFGYETSSRKNPSGGEPIITTEGMKISLFDVTDFNNPKEKFTEVIGGQGTYSSLQYDHKALFEHRARNLFGFPVSIYEKSNKEFALDYKGSGALVYEITPDKGIVLKGDLIKAKAPNEEYEMWETQIQRLIYSGDTIYTIASREINSYDMNNYKKTDSLKLR